MKKYKKVKGSFYETLTVEQKLRLAQKQDRYPNLVRDVIAILESVTPNNLLDLTLHECRTIEMIFYNFDAPCSIFDLNWFYENNYVLQSRKEDVEK